MELHRAAKKTKEFFNCYNFLGFHRRDPYCINDVKLIIVIIFQGTDQSLIPPALEMLKYLIRTSTTSMTSVPKPLKYLSPYYDILKRTHKKIDHIQLKKGIADVISLLAMGTAGGEEAKKNRDCLKYCLQGTMKNIGDWGHEYIRQLEKEIVQQWPYNCKDSTNMLMPLIHDIITFNCSHHAEIQACDLLMEIDLLHILPDFITKSTYHRYEVIRISNQYRQSSYLHVRFQKYAILIQTK